MGKIGERLEKIAIVAYFGLVLAWAGLYSHRIISNVIEDCYAVAKVEPVGEDKGNAIHGIRGFVAFDKNHDGEIDEIKENYVGMIGGRMCSALPDTTRYHKGDKRFDYLKNKYFGGKCIIMNLKD